MLLYILYRDEMAARVEHDAAISETRFVFHGHARSRPGNAVNNSLAFDLSRKQLHECLHTVE